MGDDPTHLDSHQHFHREKGLKRVFLTIARELNRPLRACAPQIRYQGNFYGQDDEGNGFAELIAVKALIKTIERLRPGVTVRVSIVAATVKNAIVVPPTALLPAADGGTSVMVVGADSVAHEKKVQVGVRDADKVQILSGVQPGNQVVVVGGVGLQDGAKVQVEKPGEKEK